MHFALSCYYFSIRMVFVSLLSACGFVLVAFCQSEWQVLAGIICTSISCGLGETSLLAYTPRFKRCGKCPIKVTLAVDMQTNHHISRQIDTH